MTFFQDPLDQADLEAPLVSQVPWDLLVHQDKWALQVLVERQDLLDPRDLPEKQGLLGSLEVQDPQGLLETEENQGQVAHQVLLDLVVHLGLEEKLAPLVLVESLEHLEVPDPVESQVLKDHLGLQVPLALQVQEENQAPEAKMDHLVHLDPRDPLGHVVKLDHQGHLVQLVLLDPEVLLEREERLVNQDQMEALVPLVNVERQVMF